MSIAIQISNLSKIYRLGEIGTGTISRDLERWYKMKIKGQEDPFLKIGETNDRGKKSVSDVVYSIREINLEVEQGEALGIIGKNGAGKSTLLKILSRVTSPTTGKINIKGRVASLLEVGTGFHPELTGRENIYLNGAILGMRKKEIIRKLDEIIDFSGVERYIDTPVKRYSSGMYVRLAFAVAAHLESEIIIVDEVLAVGDAEFQKKCLVKMSDLSKGKGRTVLFVSHNIGAVRSLCSQGILLGDGLLIASGPMDQVADKYAQSLSQPLNDSSMWSLPQDENLPLQVISIKAVDGNGQPCKNFDVTDPIDIIITHYCRKILVGSIVLVCIFYNGVELIHSFDSDTFPQRLASRQIGRYVDRIRLPSGLFKSGMLTVSIFTGIVNKSTTFQNEAAILSVNLEESKVDTSFKGYAGNRSGLLRFSPHWEIENQLL